MHSIAFDCASHRAIITFSQQYKKKLREHSLFCIAAYVDVHSEWEIKKAKKKEENQ